MPRPIKTNPEMSIDVQAIQERLAKAAPGEVVTYEELSELVGRDVQCDARYCLTSACKRLLAERVVFASVRMVGVKRLDNEGILSLPTAAFESMRRKARLTACKLTAVEYAALDREQQAQHNTAASVLGIVAHITKPKSMERLRGRVEEAQGALPIGKTLEAFK